MMYLLLCPCIENPQLRAIGITKSKDLLAFHAVIDRCRTFGIKTINLPCAETLFLGTDHEPGAYLGRLDNSDFSSLLSNLETEVRKIFDSDNNPYAIIGVDSSPVCGVRQTWYGSYDDSPGKIPGRGVFLKKFSDIPAYDVFDAACWKVYLAAPLFSEAEREYNKKIAKILSEYAMWTHLPQDCGDSIHSRELSVQNEIFQQNLIALDNADLVIAIIDGPDADSGTSWEIGYAYAKGKKIISLRTDFRKVGNNESVNLMLEQSSVVVCDIPSLIEQLPCPLPLKKQTSEQK